MYKVVPSDRLTGLLELARRLDTALDEAHAGECSETYGNCDPCPVCELRGDFQTALEWWDAIEERSNQAEDDIHYLADTAKGLLDVVDRLESALDISIPEASKLHEAIALVNEAFPAERQGQYEERG